MKFDKVCAVKSTSKPVQAWYKLEKSLLGRVEEPQVFFLTAFVLVQLDIKVKIMKVSIEVDATE